MYLRLLGEDWARCSKECPLLIKFEGEELCMGRAEGLEVGGELGLRNKSSLDCQDWPVESLVSVR